MSISNRQAAALREAEFKRSGLDIAMRSIELIIVEAQMMMKGGWDKSEMDRCDAVLACAAALAREVRTKLAADD